MTRHSKTVLTIFLLLLPCSALAQEKQPTLACSFDRNSMMALNFDQFDQDTSGNGGGWRKFESSKCRLVGASLIAEYRTAHPELNISKKSILFWHEGQMRAFAGQIDLAIPLMNRSKLPKQYDLAGWNAYADATVAFLSHNRNELLTAQQLLAATPPMEGVTITNGKATMRMDNGQSADIEWPPNSGIVNGFLRCFDKPYAEAYVRPCR